MKSEVKLIPTAVMKLNDASINRDHTKRMREWGIVCLHKAFVHFAKIIKIYRVRLKLLHIMIKVFSVSILFQDYFESRILHNNERETYIC